jgi:hypothetical protein
MIAIFQRQDYSVISSSAIDRTQTITLNQENFSFYVKITNIPPKVDINRLFVV